ncbi:MAG: tetratricopeptide repeat protein [Gemmatimonadaceae bacterium]
MSNWVAGTSLSYRDYLQARSFERSIVGTISAESREIVTSLDQASTRQVEILGQVSNDLSQGFELLHLGLQDVVGAIEQVTFGIQHLEGAIDELTAAFHWGFSEMLAATGRMNDSLAVLTGIARTPAQTWAFEQFDIARDAVRRGLYPEALQHANYAINGFGSNTGYSLEYRFHELRGVILIGSFRNNDSSILDPAEAEASFLKASRFAAHDLPAEAARALLGAGWAAYVQKASERAAQHTEAAIEVAPASAEALFQLAKIRMNLNRPDAAQVPLRRACILDPRYALKAAVDGDFQHHLNELNDVLRTLRDETQIQATVALREVAGALRTAELRAPTRNKRDHRIRIAIAREAHTRACSLLEERTYLGSLDAIAQCGDASRVLAPVLPAAFQRRASPGASA